MATGLPVSDLLDQDDRMLATLAEVAGSHWSREADLLASVIEAADVIGWRAVQPHMSKGWRPPKPLNIDRPSNRRKRRQVTIAELAERMGSRAKRIGKG